jgi:hypothetical protein
MKYLIALLFPLTLFAEVVTTTNLISQDFTDGSWDNPVNSWHSPNDLAGWNGLTHSTSVVYENDALKSGFDMTAGAEIFHWYSNQTVHITQSVTLDDGSVISQTKSYLDSRGTVHDVANTIVIGSNTSANYELGMSILFEDTRGQIGHYSADVRDPYITLTYDNTPPVQLSDTQVQEINEISSLFEDTKKEIELINITSIEEVVFEPVIETELYVTEEISIMSVDTVEDINKGIIDVFEIEEVNYDNNTQEQTFSTDFQEQEIVFETREIQEITTTETNTEEINEDIYETNFETGTTEQPIRESDTVALRETEVQEEPKEDEPRVETNNREEQSTSEPVEERVDDSESERRTEETDTVAESNAQEQNEDNTVVEETERPSDTNDERVADNRDTDQAESQELVSVEDMIKEVNATITRVDLRLIATQQILAKAMVSDLNIDSYYKSDNNVFNKRTFDGGEFYETRKYIDERNLVAQNEGVYFDPLNEHQKKLQEINDKIRILERD